MFTTFGSLGVDSGSQWKNWGGILANNSAGGGDDALIIVDKASSENGISGTLKLSRDISHHRGLLIELQGCFQPGQNNPDCTPSGRMNQQNKIIPARFFDGKKSVTIISPAFKEYNFTMKLPPSILPPDFSGIIDNVEYLLRVYKEVDSIYSLLAETTIDHVDLPGIIHPSPRTTSSIEEEICINFVKVVIRLPKKEFQRGENIPFSLKLSNPPKGSVKKVDFILWNMAKCQDEEEDGGHVSNVLDTFTFTKFAKGESCQDGYFDMEKVILPEESSQCKNKHVIQVNVRTTNNETFSTQLDVNIGRPDEMKSASGKLEAPNTAWIPGSPPPSTSSKPAYPPPEYSVLSSRANSTLSLETLPPHYDDTI